jgi:hypothetical protein
MKTFSLIIVLFLTMLIPAYAGEPRTFTDDDLNKYKSESDEDTYQYNQSVLENSRQESERQKRVNSAQGIEQSLIEERARQADRKQKAQRKIYELEKERAQDKIDDENAMKVGGFVGKRRAEERKARDLKREVEIDMAYREAGLTREKKEQPEGSEGKVQNTQRQPEQINEPQGAINTRTGEYYPPVAGGILNPRTGEVYPEVGGGYIKPSTGEFLPKH